MRNLPLSHQWFRLVSCLPLVLTLFSGDYHAMQTCYTLTLSFSGTGQTPTASPANSAGCLEGQYEAGEVITLLHLPGTGYHLSYWIGTQKSSSPQLVMPASDYSASAHYAPDGEIAVAVYDHAAMDDISYATGYHANAWQTLANILEIDPQGRFGVTVITDLSALTLAGYDCLALPDNAVPDASLTAVDAWFTAKKRLLALESAAAFAAYSGYLWPGSVGSNGQNMLWDYGSTMNDQRIVLADPITQGYTVGSVFSSAANQAQLFTAGLPVNAVVLTARHTDLSKVYVAYRDVPGKGRIIMLGPYEPVGADLYALIRNAAGDGHRVASLPLFDGFEGGALAGYWHTETSYDGRVRVSPDYPNSGAYSLLLDSSTRAVNFSIAAAVLHLDLAEYSSAELRFYWRGFGDENHPEDGLFIRSSSAAGWCKWMSFNNAPEQFTLASVNLQAAARTCGMAFSPDFQVKFQFFDNYPIPSDGYAFDDMQVEGRIVVYVPLVMR